MMRVALLLGVLLLLPAAAQSDPMEEQRCVWRCLSQSRGAGDPAYDACLRAQCMGRPAPGKSAAPRPPQPPPSAPGAKTEPLSRPAVVPVPRSQAWKTVTDLAYPAVAQCVPIAGRPNLCLVVSCPARGAMSLELYGLERGLEGAPLRLATGGAIFDLTLPSAEDDAYRWRMPIGLAETLKTEAAVSVEVAGRAHRMPLAGSSSAIGEVETRCR